MSSSVGVMTFPTEWKNKSHVPKQYSWHTMHEKYQRVLLKHFDFDTCVSVANSTFSVGHSNISFSRSLGPWFCHLCFSQPSFNALKNTCASWRLNFPAKFSTKNVLTTAPTKMMSQWQILQCLHTKRQPLNWQCEPKVWQANAESKILRFFFKMM